MSAVFPNSVPTTANIRGNLVDNLATALNGALTAIATTLIVDDTTGFPTAGLLTIQRADGTGTPELCSYTGKTGTTFTGVTRNFNSRFNSAWSDNDVVALFYAADHHNHVCEEVIAIAQNISDRLGLGQGNYIVLPVGVGIIAQPTSGQYYMITADEAGVHSSKVVLS